MMKYMSQSVCSRVYTPPGTKLKATVHTWNNTSTSQTSMAKHKVRATGHWASWSISTSHWDMRNMPHTAPPITQHATHSYTSHLTCNTPLHLSQHTQHTNSIVRQYDFEAKPCHTVRVRRLSTVILCLVYCNKIINLDLDATLSNYVKMISK